MDIDKTASLLKLLEVSNRYPPLRPIHDSALRQLVVIAQAEAEAWTVEKDKLEKEAAAKAVAEAAKVKAAAPAPMAKRTIPTSV